MKKVLILIILFAICTGLAAQSTSSKSSTNTSPFLFEKGNTSVKFGGFVRFVTLADFGGVVPNFDFVSSTMPAPGEWDKEHRLSMDASATRLNLKVVQKTESLGDVEFYIETDFRGAADVLRLRQAYISFKGFTFGQAWSLMTDFAANTTLIDIQGVNSRTFFRTPLISYKANLDENLSFGASLEFPRVKATIQANSGIRAVNQTFPDIPLYLQYKGKRGHIKLAGLLRAMDYGINSTEKIKTELGAGAQLSWSLKLDEKFTLVSQSIYGKGVARYINDLAALNLDLAPAQGSKLQSLPMYGLSLGMRADFSKKLFATSNYSIAGLTNKDDYYSAGEYFKGNYFSASLFYAGIKNMTIAGEYIHGYRKNMNSTWGSANRLQVMFMYSW